MAKKANALVSFLGRSKIDYIHRMVKTLSNERCPSRAAFLCDVGRNSVRASEAHLCVRLRECVLRGPHHSDSYLVDPASNICLFQRLSHACLRISELIQ